MARLRAVEDRHDRARPRGGAAPGCRARRGRERHRASGYSVSGRTRGIEGVNEPSRLTRFADNLQAPFTQSKEHGAWPVVRAVADPDVVSGEFWGPRGLVKGAPGRARPSRSTRGTELGERLWDWCEEATRVQWPLTRAARESSRARVSD